MVATNKVGIPRGSPTCRIFRPGRRQSAQSHDIRGAGRYARPGLPLLATKRSAGSALARGVDVTYGPTRQIFDADSHLMELPGWLESYADPDIRDDIRPLALGGAGALAENAIAAAEARRGDAAAAR